MWELAGWVAFGLVGFVLVVVALTRLLCDHDWTTDRRGYVCRKCGSRPWID